MTTKTLSEMTRLNAFQRELSTVVQWDPNEPGLNPSVDINNTKVNHVAKKLITSIGKEDEMTKTCGADTLYNALKQQPMGNLFLFIMEQISYDDLLELAKKGKQENGLYPYAMDSGLEYVEHLRNTTIRMNELAKIPDEIALGSIKLEMPDEPSRLAIDALLGKSGLPALEELFNELTTFGDKQKERDDKIKELTQEGKKMSKDLDTLRSELRDVSARALMSEVKVEANADLSIPEGEMKWKKASELFSSISKKNDFEVPYWEWDGPHPDVPAVDPHYIFREKLLIRILYALVTNKRAYLQGHTGSGKTTLLEQVAAHLNWPFARVNFDSEITRMDLIGRDVLRTDDAGRTYSTFEDGLLPRMMSGPYMGCFDEIDFCRPDVAYVMQAAAEGNGLRITEDGDRVVNPHPMFRMFATGNTVGQGDEHGMYQGARPQSLAFLDRFTVWLKVPYLAPKERDDLLKRHFPALSEDQHKAITQYVTEHLEAFTTGKCLQPISPRGMLAIAQATVILGDLKEALRMTVLDRASNTDHSVLNGLVDRVVK